MSHDSEITKLRLADPYVPSSHDTTVRVWNSDAGECCHIICVHSSQVSLLLVDQDKAVTESLDGTIEI